MSLVDLLRKRIAIDGPISLADYMQECLLHPAYGYYSTRDPLGVQGDFTTAPEISQMFGELLGLSLAQTWVDQGSPSPFALAELGPGRGTLMVDLLRATKAVQGFHDALNLHLVEASPALRKEQATRLNGFGPHWHNTVETMSEATAQMPLFLVANEFFDALPVRQFIRSGTQWAERRIGWDGKKLGFGLTAPTPQPALAHRLEDTQESDLVEHSAPSLQITDTIARHITQVGGAALIVDYGDWRSLGDTLQALRAHAPSNPLDAPGQADLTTHVDFEAITMAAQRVGCAYSRLTPQGVFLERLGITQRANQLADKLTCDPLDQLIAAHRRLTHPQEMGNLFKVIGLFPKQSAPPAGLNA